MRMRSRLLLLALSLALPSAGVAQGQDRINPMIALHERGLPVFGVTHPAIVTGGRGPGTAVQSTAPLPSLADAARDTVAYRDSDFAYDNYSSATADRFLGYMGAMLAAGGSAREHAFLSKVPIIHADPALATARIVEQLNAGHVGVMLQEVEAAEEVRTALAAMRFASKGGTRPDAGVGLAAAYWKLSEAEYREKAEPWPLNPRGELVLWAIVESKKGIANIREIAQVPGLTVIVVGAGTLGGVYSTMVADGQRVRDQEGFDAGVSAILSACKEFKVPCSHPANNPQEIAALMARGFTVFTMQRRDAAAFEAIATGRTLAGRPGQRPSAPRPSAAATKSIVGTWLLMTRTVARADGTTIVDPVLGERPIGRLIYEPNGVMSLQMMRTGRKSAISTPASQRDKSNPRVITGYDSYFGRYTVDENTSAVTHHVEGSLFPEDLGSAWVRPFTIDGDKLTLRVTSGDGLTRTLVFERVR